MSPLVFIGTTIIAVLLTPIVRGNTGALMGELLHRNILRARPVVDERTVVDVKLEIVPRRVLCLSEIRQEIKVFVWLRVEWKDELFQWDPAEYNGTEYVFIDKEYAWHPDIVLYQSNDEPSALPESRNIPLIVHSDGTVMFLTPTIYTTHCRMNLTLYPFDTQTCKLKFGSWAYNGNMVNVTSRVASGETESFLQNGEWDLEAITITNNVFYYSCCPEPYPDVEYTLRLKRSPLFYVLNLIVPFVVLVLLSATVFVIPPESGEKVSLAITTLLSLLVFTQLVLETVPAASDGTKPIIGVYFVGSVVGVAGVVLAAVLSVHAYNNKDSGKPVPGFVRFIVLTCMGTLCYKLRCLRKARPTDSSEINRTIPGCCRRTRAATYSPSKREQGDSCTVYSNQVANGHAEGGDTGVFSISDVITAFPFSKTPGRTPRASFAAESGNWNTSANPNTTGSESLHRVELMIEELLRKRGGGAVEEEPHTSEGIASHEWVEVSRVMDRFLLVSFAISVLVVVIINTVKFGFGSGFE